MKSTVVLETASGGRNGSRTRDGRSGSPDRRRSIPVWIRDHHRVREGSQGTFRRHHPVYFSEEKRTGLDAGVAARSLSPLAHHAGAELGARRLSEDRLPGSLLLRRAEAEEGNRLA